MLHSNDITDPDIDGCLFLPPTSHSIHLLQSRRAICFSLLAYLGRILVYILPYRGKLFGVNNNNCSLGLRERGGPRILNIKAIVKLV